MVRLGTTQSMHSRLPRHYHGPSYHSMDDVCCYLLPPEPWSVCAQKPRNKVSNSDQNLIFCFDENTCRKCFTHARLLGEPLSFWVTSSEVHYITLNKKLLVFSYPGGIWRIPHQVSTCEMLKKILCWWTLCICDCNSFRSPSSGIDAASSTKKTPAFLIS
jgi:hypothetical protein